MFSHPDIPVIQPVVYGQRDAKGNRSKAWPESARFEQPGCFLAPRFSQESTTRGYDERVAVGLTLYGPYDIKLGPEDRVIWQGQTYQVEGIVARHRNPFTGWKAGSEVALATVTSA